MADPRFLLDSNICIYLLEGLSDQARLRAEQCRPGEIITSAIVYAEVMRGLGSVNKNALDAVNRFFEMIAVVPFDRGAAGRYPEIPFKRGKFDRLIAAHALALNLTLVTNNEQDFADVRALRVENWTR